MFDPNESYTTFMGQLVSNVKYVQGGNAYGNNKRFLGKFVDGKLQRIKAAEPIRGELDLMGRGELLAYALKEHGLTLKGNAAAETLRQQIREHDVS